MPSSIDVLEMTQATAVADHLASSSKAS